MTDATAGSTTSMYVAIGGEAGVRKLVARFYVLMDTLPEAKACRDVHPATLEGSETKLCEYLTGWLGGPQLYVAKHGHPRLRQRHLHAPIGKDERDGWLICFERAAQETLPDAVLREALLEPVRKLALHMENKAI